MATRRTVAELARFEAGLFRVSSYVSWMGYSPSQSYLFECRMMEVIIKAQASLKTSTNAGKWGQRSGEVREGKGCSDS